MSERAARLLRGYLPSSWSVEPSRESTAILIRTPDQAQASLEVVAKRTIEPRGVSLLSQRLQGAKSSLVFAYFLAPRTRELLLQAGASYMDEHGNVCIKVDRPAIYVRLEGADKNPARAPQPLASLKGPASARVVRALCDFLPPFGVRELARRAEASAASVSRVVALVEREALLERRDDEVASVDWAGLLRRWTSDYQFLKSNEVATFLEPRGMDALLTKLKSCNTPTAITGSLAASRKAPIAPARNAAIYVRDVSEAGEQLKLRPIDTGGNVFLVRSDSGVAFTRTWVEEGLTYSSLSQVAADLLTSPGRAPEEGNELIGWMKNHVGDWRS